MDPYLIVVGCPGSGVEEVQRILTREAEVAVAPSLYWITAFYKTRTGLNWEGVMPPQLLRKWVEHNRFDAFGLERETVQGLLAEDETVPFKEFIGRLLKCVSRLKEKRLVGSISLEYLEMLPTVRRLWPDTRIIHLIRDGRDVCRALMEEGGPAAAPVARFAEVYDRPIRTALWWQQAVSRGRETGRQLGPAHYHEIQYESLLAAPDCEHAALRRFLGLTKVRGNAGATVLSRTEGGTSGGRGTGPVIDRRRSALSGEDLEGFEAAAGPLLTDLGYPLMSSSPAPGVVRQAARVRQLIDEDEAVLARSTPQAIAARRSANKWRNPFVFIVGCPRSGTTLVQRIVDSHPDLAICPETFWLPYFIRKRIGVAPDGSVRPELIAELLRYYKFCRMRVGRDELEALVDSDEPVPYSGFVSRVFDLYGEYRGKSLVGDKTPDYVRHVATLHALWPEAKVVHLIRDGRDVCLSAINWKRKAGRMAELYSTWNADPVTTAALWWDQNVRQGREAGKALGSPLYFELRYEDLVARPEEECARLSAFLGVPFVDGMLRFHEGRTVNDPALDAKNAWRPITAGLRDWRSQMAAEDIARFETAAGPLLLELGYPLSCSSPNAAMVVQATKIGQQFSQDSSHIGEWLP